MFYFSGDNFIKMVPAAVQIWTLWLLVLLYHPWVKNTFKEIDYRENDCSKPKMFCQSEQTPLLPQGYFMDFCERSEYSNCAGGKNSWQSVCCPGCKRPLTRHLEYAGTGTVEANCNAGYNGFLLLHAKNSDRK